WPGGAPGYPRSSGALGLVVRRTRKLLAGYLAPGDTLLTDTPTPAARRGPGGAARHRRHARRPRTGTAAADAGGGGRGAGLAAAPPGTAAGRDARPGGPRRRGGGRGR